MSISIPASEIFAIKKGSKNRFYGLSLILLSLLLISSTFQYIDHNPSLVTPPSNIIDVGHNTNGRTTKYIQAADKNNNKIADNFEEFIALYNQGRTSSYPYDAVMPDTTGNVQVIIISKTTQLSDDIKQFSRYGGVPTRIWDSVSGVLYGFTGKIPINNVYNFIGSSSENIQLIEQNHYNHQLSDVSTKLTRLNPYVWDDLGYKGDPDMAVAVLDTGIDDSHSAFSPGYGDLNWSKKIIGWYDATADASTTPEDFGGHGSHVSGILASNPYNSSYIDGRLKTTINIDYTASGISGYLPNDIFINKTGTIEVNYLWQKTAGSGSASGSYLQLVTPNNVLATEDLSGSTNMSVSYIVSSSLEFGIWEVRLGLQYGNGQSKTLAMSSTTIYPYENPTTGSARFCGVAPNTKLVGVKIFDNTGAGTEVEAINGFNWIATNKATYHITVASGSFGFTSTVASVDTAASNLVNQGVVVVIAAGNDGQTGTNQIFSPGDVDEVITVAASDDYNQIASYSSQGPGTVSTSIKPDITAPGGELTQGGILQVDSNDNDGPFADQIPNDFTNIEGTSMATPFVSGVLALMIEAMGGYANWNYGDNSLPYLLKQQLLATASEIYQNQRTSKDTIEGAGLINPDAAIESIVNTYQFTSTVTENLDHNGSARKVWASEVQLLADSDYAIELSVPVTADFDLFLYENTPNAYGEPVIFQSSTNSGFGNDEQIIVNTTVAVSYTLVVRTINDPNSKGAFTLTSTTTSPPDLTAPTISSPSDLAYVVGNTGNVISWVASDDFPATYNITENNQVLIPSENWTNSLPIELNVDGKPVGEYVYNITVSDSSGNSNSDIVKLSVVNPDTISPDVSSPQDIEFNEGSVGKQITWIAGDINPGTYSISRDGQVIKENMSWANGTISVSLDGLAHGTYEFILTVFDILGNSNSDTVTVTVIAANNTATGNNPPTGISSITSTNTTTSNGGNNDSGHKKNRLSFPLEGITVLTIFISVIIIRRRVERKQSM